MEGIPKSKDRKTGIEWLDKKIAEYTFLTKYENGKPVSLADKIKIILQIISAESEERHRQKENQYKLANYFFTAALIILTLANVIVAYVNAQSTIESNERLVNNFEIPNSAELQFMMDDHPYVDTYGLSNQSDVLQNAFMVCFRNIGRLATGRIDISWDENHWISGAGGRLVSKSGITDIQGIENLEGGETACLSLPRKADGRYDSEQFAKVLESLSNSSNATVNLKVECQFCEDGDAIHLEPVPLCFKDSKIIRPECESYGKRTRFVNFRAMN